MKLDELFELLLSIDYFFYFCESALDEVLLKQIHQYLFTLQTLEIFLRNEVFGLRVACLWNLEDGNRKVERLHP